MTDNTDNSLSSEAAGGRVYDTPVQAGLLFLLPGLAQGFAIWSLGEYLDEATRPVGLIALLMFVLVAPIAHFLTTSVGNRLPAIVFSLLLGGGTAGLFLLADASFGGLEETAGQVVIASVFANLLICYIAAPFFRTMFERHQAPAHYPSLFEFAWNLPVIGLAAFLFTLAVWLVLGIWSALFDILGIDFFKDFFFDEARGWPITAGAFATAIGIVRAREEIVLALRNVLFALLKVISPILTAATVLFVLAALVSGLDELWSGWSATSLMVMAIAGAVILNNAVIGDQGRPDNLVLRWSVRIQSLVLVVLAAFAIFGIYLRLKEYGITVERFYALLIVIFAAAYGVAYFFSALRDNGHELARRANIWLAGAAFVVAVLVQTPLLSPYKATANNQLARLASGKVSASDFDYGYVRFRLGKEGARLLDRLENDDTLPEQEIIQAAIARVRAADDKYDYNTEVEQIVAASEVADMLASGQLKVLPQETVLPDGLIRFFENSRWFLNICKEREERRCILIEESGFNVAAPQFVLITDGYGDYAAEITLLYQNQREEGWQRLEGTRIEFRNGDDQQKFWAQIDAGTYGTAIVPVRVLQAGGRTIFFQTRNAGEQGILAVPSVPQADGLPVD